MPRSHGLKARRFLALLVVCALFHSAYAATGAAQSDQIELKGELFEVRAVVADKQGMLRGDLTRDDFELFADGEVRDLAFFAVERPGGEPAASSVLASPSTSVSTGPQSSALHPGAPRTVVLFVDAVNLSSSSLTRVKRSLGEFIDSRLAPNDVVAIVSSSGSLGIDGQFTSDRNVLHRAIDRIAPRQRSIISGAFTPYLAAEIIRGTNPEALAAGQYLVRLEDGVTPPPDPDVPGGSPTADRLALAARQKAIEVLAEAGAERRATLATLKAVIENLSKAPGQRLLGLVSDGFTLFDRGGERETAEVKQTIARAVRAGVVIYSLSGSGLESGVLSGPDDPVYSLPTHIFPGYASSSRRDLEDGLTALARDTGGEVFRNTNDLAGALGRMLDANGIYYVLSFYPAEGKSSPRKIEVRLRNHKDLSVRYQRGVDAPVIPVADTAAPQPLVDALTAPVPPTSLPVSMRAEVVAAHDADVVVNVSVHLDAEKLLLKEVERRRAFSVEVATVVLDERGKSVDTKFEVVDGVLDSRAYDLARQYGLRVTRQTTVKPGRYQVRVAVRDVASGRIGTKAEWVIAPDVGSGALALGGVRLSEVLASTDDVRTPRTVDGVRTLHPSASLVYSLPVFNPPAEGGSEIRLQISQQDRVLFRSAWEAPGQRLSQRAQRTAILAGQLGLGNLETGTYRLRVELRDRTRKASAAGEVDFAIVR